VATFVHRRAAGGRPGPYLRRLKLGRVGRFIGGTAILAVAWPLYVFDSSQLAFAAALVVACAIAADLAWARAQLLVLLLVGLLLLLGPEANGELAAGHPMFGSLRLIDAALAVALVSLAAGGALRRLRGSARLGPAAAARHPLALLLAFAVAWVTTLWLVEGPQLDSLARTDVRLIFLAGGFFCVARTCRSRPAVELAPALAVLAVVLLGKALAIYLTDFWTIGTYDRLQAATVFTALHPRVILVGGDTLLVLAPGLAIVALARAQGLAWRIALGAFALCGVAGVLISGTRTSVLVAVATVLLAGLLATWILGRGGASVAVWLVIALIGLAFAAGAASTDVSERLTTADAPHVGLNFRKDEARALLRLPRHELLLGQGIGGSFIGKNVLGERDRTGWAHTFPLWVLLKAGVVGALAALLLLAAAVRAGWGGMRAGGVRANDASTGLVILFGVLVMSLTLGRAALPEGVALIAIAAALLGTARDVSS